MDCLFPEHEDQRFENKIQMAIERIRMASDMAHRYLDAPLYVCLSGGKDSSVIQQLSVESGCDVVFTHSHTTVDAPETVYFIRDEMKRLESLGYQTQIIKPKMSMWRLIEYHKGRPPIRTMRYCCAYFKEHSVRLATGRKAFICTGVRWEESRQRRDRAEFEVIAADKKNAVKVLANDNDLQRKLFEDCKLKGERVVNPIIDWNEEDVWRYIKERGVPYNPLYNEGWKRIGCVGCPMGSPDQRKRQFERWPKFKENYIRAIERGMEKGRAEGIEYTWGGEESDSTSGRSSAEAVFNRWHLMD